jgi:hypothetical protein
MTQLPLSPEKPAIQRKQLTARESFILTIWPVWKKTGAQSRTTLLT